jgi:hypothetical protein
MNHKFCQKINEKKKGGTRKSIFGSIYHRATDRATVLKNENKTTTTMGGKKAKTNKKDIMSFHVDPKIIQEASACMKTCKSLSNLSEKLTCVLKQKKECEAYKQFSDVSEQCGKTKCKKERDLYTKLFNALATDKNEKTKKKFESSSLDLSKCKKKHCPTLE